MKRTRLSSRPLYDIFTEIAEVGSKNSVVKHGKITAKHGKINQNVNQNVNQNPLEKLEYDSDAETVSVDLDIDKRIQEIGWEVETRPKSFFFDVNVNVDAEAHVFNMAGESHEQDDVEIEDEDETVQQQEQEEVTMGEINMGEINIGDEIFKLNNKWLRMENHELEMNRCELELGETNDENERRMKEQNLRMKDFDDEGFRMDDIAEVGGKINNTDKNQHKKDELSYTLSDIENYNRNDCVNNLFLTGGGFSSAYFTTESSKQSDDKYDDANSAFIGCNIGSSTLLNVDDHAKNMFSGLSHLASLGLANFDAQISKDMKQSGLDHAASDRLALNIQCLNSQAFSDQASKNQAFNLLASTKSIHSASNCKVAKWVNSSEFSPDPMASKNHKTSHLNHPNQNPSHQNPSYLNPSHLNHSLLHPNHLNPNHLNPNHLNPNHLNPSHLNLDPSNSSIIQEKPCFLQIQITFNKFLAYIKTMRWTIAFIGHEFEYSPTRMGEILKLKNIKNGKRKFREWSKISDRMVDIMNNRALTMEYELLFQQFQGDYIKNSKKIKKRRNMGRRKKMGEKFDRIEQSLLVLKDESWIEGQ